MIIIHALMQVDPAKREAFLAEAQHLLAATHAEEGNLSYELYEHAGVSNSFIMVETWRDSAAVEAHNASSHFQAFAGKAGEFLSAPLDVKVYGAEPVSK
ncbi:antibiotic biosynthesis monooxygenase [Paenibacillus sp. HN-1]|uniref:putative quinol monooxygenase n=1 Tax=Paenibacillus TaxID=44249 RepID=UPI001CA7E4DC|nr:MULTISPECIES: putative quinol monooxygenase [Paenibacillus]MBY9079905.1 antibiotic biosynthesis monooxygenase [Paenibacillus sp. CGMCC 1.18879]MBY9084546.1 antibiotic biosynthesis monooxygenase [Paenibacillus sinensis]